MRSLSAKSLPPRDINSNAAHDGVPAIVMTIHTFGEHLDFHPHLHTLVADGLFDREGKFHVMGAGELAQAQRGTTDAHLAGNHPALEQLFRARVIAFLIESGLLPADRARILRGWVHSGYQVLSLPEFCGHIDYTVNWHIASAVRTRLG